MSRFAWSVKDTGVIVYKMIRILTGQNRYCKVIKLNFKSKILQDQEI